MSPQRSAMAPRLGLPFAHGSWRRPMGVQHNKLFFARGPEPFGASCRCGTIWRLRRGSDGASSGCIRSVLCASGIVYFFFAHRRQGRGWGRQPCPSPWRRPSIVRFCSAGMGCGSCVASSTTSSAGGHEQHWGCRICACARPHHLACGGVGATRRTAGCEYARARLCLVS